MRIGLGVPTAIARSPAGLNLEWAQLAEVGPFASALAAAAAVTRRVRLAWLVLIAPCEAVRSCWPSRCVRSPRWRGRAGSPSAWASDPSGRLRGRRCLVRAARPPAGRTAGRSAAAARRRSRAVDRWQQPRRTRTHGSPRPMASATRAGRRLPSARPPIVHASPGATRAGRDRPGSGGSATSRVVAQQGLPSDLR